MKKSLYMGGEPTTDETPEPAAPEPGTPPAPEEPVAA